MATKIQIRRDSEANWTSANPTLSSGEQGFETDTGKFKIGDGSTAWASLEYAGGGYPEVESDNFLEASAADYPSYMIYVGNIANRINLVTEGNALSWDNAFATLEEAFAFVTGHNATVAAYNQFSDTNIAHAYMIVLEDEGAIHAVGAQGFLTLDNIGVETYINSQSQYRLTTPATNPVAQIGGTLYIESCSDVYFSSAITIDGDLDIANSFVYLSDFSFEAPLVTTGDILITKGGGLHCELDELEAFEIFLNDNSYAYFSGLVTLTGDLDVQGASACYFFDTTSCDDLFLDGQSFVYVDSDLTMGDDCSVDQQSTLYTMGDLTAAFVEALDQSTVYVADDIISGGVDIYNQSILNVDGNLSCIINGSLDVDDQSSVFFAFPDDLTVTSSIFVNNNSRALFACPVALTGLSSAIVMDRNSQATFTSTVSLPNTTVGSPSTVTGGSSVFIESTYTASAAPLIIDRNSLVFCEDAVSCFSISVLSGSSLYSYGDITATGGAILVEEASSMAALFDVDVASSKITTSTSLDIDENSYVWAESGATIGNIINIRNGSCFISDNATTAVAGDINVYYNSSFYSSDDVSIPIGNMEVHYNSKVTVLGLLTAGEWVECRYNSSVYVDSDLTCEYFDVTYNSDLSVASDVTVTADTTADGGYIDQNGRVYLNGSIVQSSATHTGGVVLITTGGELTHDSSSLSVAGSGTFTIDGATTLTTAQFTGKSFFGNGGSAVKDVNAAGKVAFLGMPTTDPNDGLSLWVDTAASNVVKLSVVV